MFSKQFVSTKQVIRAAVLGMFIGLAGVGIFALLLINASTLQEGPMTTTEEVPDDEVVEVSTLPQQTVNFYANQYGAFTTHNSATEFMATYPTLNKALVIQVEDKFYVWSTVSLEKITVEGEPTSFAKSFQLYSEACTQNSIANIPVFLKDDNNLKNNFEQSTNQDQLPKEWTTYIDSITSLSSDINVIRLHVLAHFLEQQSCLKIKFDA